MHDGAPPHFSRISHDFLNQTYGDRWIGRGGPTLWPPRSPDLNPIDFYLLGHLKTIVHATPVRDIQDLHDRITAGCETIRCTPGIFERVHESMRRRVTAYIYIYSRNL